MKTYTERLLDKATDIWENSLNTLDGLPDPAEYQQREYGLSSGKTFNYPSEYQRLKKLLNERTKLGWSSGVFDALASVGMEEQKKNRITFNQGAGI